MKSDKALKFDAVLQFVLQKIGAGEITEDHFRAVKFAVRALIQKFETRWARTNRHYKRFLDINSSWLEGVHEEYPWYNMPVNIHKIMYHGKEVIGSCIIPAGQMSEEAQEDRNKDNGDIESSSRINTNTDLMHRLVISSDPYISSLRQSAYMKREHLSTEVINILNLPDCVLDNDNEGDFNCDSDVEL